LQRRLSDIAAAAAADYLHPLDFISRGLCKKVQRQQRHTHQVQLQLATQSANESHQWQQQISRAFAKYFLKSGGGVWTANALLRSEHSVVGDCLSEVVLAYGVTWEETCEVEECGDTHWKDHSPLKKCKTETRMTKNPVAVAP
jgi:hypothetical protein